MKIVAADPVILSENSKCKLGTLGELELFNSTPASANDYIERIKDAEILLVGKARISQEVLQHASHLKMICVCHTGFDNIDLSAATAHGIIVSNVPDYASEAVAEFVFALALDILRKIEIADTMAHKGEFDDRYYLHNRLLAGKTIGVIGTGSIGRRVIQIAHSFGMSVISTTAHPNPEREEELGVKFMPLDNLLTESDIVTLHIPLTPETKHMIDARELRMMKPTAILINTSRGKVINEDALIDTLRNKAIAGAALDVFEKEPLKSDSPLLKLDNLVLTPHIAYLSEETTDKCADIAAENAEMFLRGRPQNVVNPDVLKKTANDFQRRHIMDTGIDWTGTWETNYGKVELQQANDTVTGVYVLKQGRINGRTSGNKLIGEWSEAPSYAPPNDGGEFEIHMDLSGRSFKGKWWKLGPAKEHEWSGRKV